MGQVEADDWANSATPNRIQRAIAEHQVWVAELADQVVGWVEFDRNRIEGLYVDPKYSCQGIGSALLTHAEEQIGSVGCPTVELHASLNAEQFYANRGYQSDAKRSKDKGLPMAKNLDIVAET